MENVRGLTTYKGGDFFTDVFEEFNSLKGYTETRSSSISRICA
jgi:site-specific DNA-cytosine methylase